MTPEETLRLIGYLLLPFGMYAMRSRQHPLGIALLVLATSVWVGPAALRAARRERDRVRDDR